MGEETTPTIPVTPPASLKDLRRLVVVASTFGFLMYAIFGMAHQPGSIWVQWGLADLAVINAALLNLFVQWRFLQKALLLRPPPFDLDRINSVVAGAVSAHATFAGTLGAILAGVILVTWPPETANEVLIIMMGPAIGWVYYYYTFRFSDVCILYEFAQKNLETKRSKGDTNAGASTGIPSVNEPIERGIVDKV